MNSKRILNRNGLSKLGGVKTAATEERVVGRRGELSKSMKKVVESDSTDSEEEIEVQVATEPVAAMLGSDEKRKMGDDKMVDDKLSSVSQSSPKKRD